MTSRYGRSVFLHSRTENVAELLIYENDDDIMPIFNALQTKYRSI